MISNANAGVSEAKPGGKFHWVENGNDEDVALEGAAALGSVSPSVVARGPGRSFRFVGCDF